MKHYLSIIGLSFVLAACQGSGPITETIIVEPPVSSLDELASLSVEARHELRLLAKAQESIAQQAMTPQQHEDRFRQATYMPAGFEGNVDFRFTGLASEAAKAIAILADYEILFYGEPAANEPFVRLQVDRQPLNEAIKELGLQTGDAIRIELHPAARLMRFIYN